MYVYPTYRVGQNRIYRYIYTVYLVIFKPKIPYVHCIYIYIYIWSWPTLSIYQLSCRCPALHHPSHPNTSHAWPSILRSQPLTILHTQRLLELGPQSYAHTHSPSFTRKDQSCLVLNLTLTHAHHPSHTNNPFARPSILCSHSRRAAALRLLPK